MRTGTSKQIRHFYEFGPFHLDTAERVLLFQGEPVPLTIKAFDTLLALVQDSGRVIEKSALMRKVWPDTFVEENNLTQNISLLRKALGRDTSGNKYIQTISRRGYRFLAVVKEVWDEVNDIHLINSSHRPGDEAVIKIGAIAVLPFKTLGAENDDGYLGMGLADVLITRLSKIGLVTVRPTTDVLKYTDQAQDLLAVGRELGVDSLLDGHIQRLGDRIRVTVQLVGVRDGLPLWAEKFDETFTDVFAVQDRVSELVTRALRLKLNGEERVKPSGRHAENTEAHNLYLKGRYFWNRRTEESLKKSIHYFERAMDRDPNYGPAYAGLADSYCLLGIYCYLSPKEALSNAKAAAVRALEIDESLAEAHVSLADIRLHYDWDPSGAEVEYNRAIELNPYCATAHHRYSVYLLTRGWFGKAMTEIKKAQELDPLSLIINTALSLPYFYARQYDQAIEKFHKVLEMDPSFAPAHYYLGLAHEKNAMHKAAIAEFQKAIELSGGCPLMIAALGHAYAGCGKTREAQKVLDELKEMSKRKYVSSYHIATIYAGLGEKATAFHWLEEAYKERSCFLIRLKIDPLLDGLRSDPRFFDLMQRVRNAE
ncbi:MAG: winged helix-turn-helix domain-containing protein [Blastocatellia bacterium]|nr:winged helix-turn-helix domain-containing protein [Blastocatellia bacterium]